MTTKTEQFLEPFVKKNLPEIRPGDTVKVYQKIKEAAKESKRAKKQDDKGRTQVFEGVVLAKKHGKGISGTFTVRKIVGGIGVERIFPLHSPNIEKIEIVAHGKVRRAKLYYLRKRVGKKTRLKRKPASVAAGVGGGKPAPTENSASEEALLDKSISEPEK